MYVKNKKSISKIEIMCNPIIQKQLLLIFGVVPVSHQN